MPITVLNVIPVYILEEVNIKLSLGKKLFISRISTILISVILALFVFIWARSLYGLKAAFFSLLLFAFCPNLLGHSRLATNDVYAACFMFLAAYFFIRYLKQPSAKNLILSASLTGIAQVAKYTALMLFPFFILFYISTRFMPVNRYPSAHLSFKKTLVHIILFLLIVIGIVNLGYGLKGISLTNVIPLPQAYVEAFLIGMKYNATGEGHALVYLMGQLSQYGFWYYYFICLLLKMPLAVFIFGIISLMLFKKYFMKNPVDEMALLLIPLGLLVFFSFFCTAQIGIRYLLPAFPFGYVFLGKIASYRIKKYYRFYEAGLAGLLLWFIISSLSFYPHYISYFNELIGDRKNMYKYLADSNVDWGQNGIYVHEYIQRHGGEEKISVRPPQPTDGLVLVNVNHLVGIFPTIKDKYAWLREKHEPVDHIGYSWLVYRIPLNNIKKR
ncbi:MAG: ArnT family glycosyltransferase [Candidatus Aminicenantes bacterium]